jgi:tetratricopeptide (TPR) repeat protein
MKRMDTRQRLESDIKDAMRAKDELRKRTLRMALSSIRLAEIEKGEALDEQATLALLHKEIKSRQESIADAERAGRRRRAYCKAYQGWAAANLGQYETALASFTSGADDTSYSLLGVDETPLHLFWGKTLTLQGEPEEAMDKLSKEALFGSKDATQAFEEAWVATHGSIEGLEERLWALRQEHAKPLPPFALRNYRGETFESTEHIGDVLLIAAWNPT